MHTNDSSVNADEEAPGLIIRQTTAFEKGAPGADEEASEVEYSDEESDTQSAPADVVPDGSALNVAQPAAPAVEAEVEAGVEAEPSEWTEGGTEYTEGETEYTDDEEQDEEDGAAAAAP